VVATEDIEKRIRKDIALFSYSLEKTSTIQLSGDESRVVELAKMYAKDAEAWLAKGDMYTSFSSIAYAHGLMDSILKLKHVIE
jgi:hypothetical protein